MTQCVNNTNAYTLMGSLSLLQARISQRTELIASERAARVMAGQTWRSYELALTPMKKITYMSKLWGL